MNSEQRAKVAYNAYCNRVNWKSFKGDDLPKFENLPEHIRDAWMAAGDAVASYYTTTSA